MATVRFCVKTANISGLRLIDLDTPHWAITPVLDGDWQDKEAVKADGEYFRIPEGTEIFATIFTDENKITEFEALGLQRIVDKYLSKHCEISVA